MATMQELEALREKPESNAAPVVAPPADTPVVPVQPVVAPPVKTGPTLRDLIVGTRPALDTTHDGPSPLDKSLDFADKFEPGFHYVNPALTEEAARANVDQAFQTSTPLPTVTEDRKKNAWDQVISANSKVLDTAIAIPEEFLRGAINTGIDTLQAPGYLAKSIHEANILGDPGVKFDYSWKAPVSSLLYGTTELLQKLQDEVNSDQTPESANSKLAQIPQAFGSSAAFLFGGALSGAEKVAAQGLVAGGLGAASGATSQYEDALAHGADPNEALMAYGGGAAFGSTEGFPGYFFLKRLNKLGGGKLLEKLQEFGMQGESGAVREAVKGALTEMTQEGVQTVGGNWVASDLAGYDPTRTLGENFWDNVLSAGVVGSVLGGGLHGLHQAELGDAKDALQAEWMKQFNSGDAINTLSTPGNGFGSFTPIENLMQLNKLKADLDRHIDQKAELALSKLGQGFNPEEQLLSTADVDEINDAFNHPKDQKGPFPEMLNPAFTGPTGVLDAQETAFVSSVGNANVNSQVEKGLLANRGGKPLSAREALTMTDVVTLPSRYDEFLKVLNKNIARHEDLVKNYEIHNSHDNEGTLPPKDALERQLAIMKLRQEQLGRKNEIANQLLRHVKDLTAGFRSALNPDLKMVIRDSNPYPGQTPRGWFTGSQNVELAPGKTASVGTLFINLESIVDEIYAGGQSKNSLEYRNAKRQLFEVVNHELGHSVLSKHFHDVVNTIAKGDPAVSRAAYKTFVLIKDEYSHWLQDMVGTNWRNFTETATPFQRGAAFNQKANELGQPLSEIPIENDLPKGFPQKEYLLSFDEFFADMTARLATQGHLDTPELTSFFKPVMEQYQKLFNTYPAWAKSEYGNNWKEFLQSRALSFKIKEEIENAKTRASNDLWDALRGKVPGLNPDNFVGLKQQFDRWNKGLSWGLNLLQMEQVFPHVPQFATYRTTAEAWAAYQRNFAAEATETLENWRSLGKKEASELTDVLFEESEKKANLSTAEIGKRLSGESLLVYNQIRKQLNRVLDEMQETALVESNRQYAMNPEKLDLANKAIKEEFKSLKDSGYFPYIRFGNWTITARASKDTKFQGQNFKAGELITFQAFESRSARDEAYSSLRKELGGTAAVSASKMRESEYTVQGMPRSLLLGLRNRLQADGQLTDEVAKSIDQSLEAAAPFKNFRNHFKKRKEIHGYSEDAFRAFAHYIRSAAGNIARVRYAGEMRDSIDSMQGDVKTIQEIGGNATYRQEMTHWLKRHFDYIMNPASEFAGLRGVGFVAYLGFNVKSAFVNSTQMLTTTYPYLAARHGDVQAVSEMGKAGNWLKKWVFQKDDFINAKEGSKEQRISQLIARGKSEGWLDQSLATELAIAASENSLDRSMYLPSYKRFWHNFSRWSALPFHLVEKTNRYVTAISAYNLEYNESQNHEKALLAAKLANQQTNFENARWNRPEFLRGKKSAALLFQNFIQNQLFFITKDPGSTRYFFVMLMLAGVMGLPGADDLADILDAAATKLNKELGMKNPKVQLRVEMRKYLDELGANPDLVMHGTSQNSFGLGQVGELTGLPIPKFDLSNSIGMGNIIPGTDLPNQMMNGGSPGDVALNAFSQAGGASGNLIEDYYRGLFSKEPNDWKRIEKLLPLMSVRNMSKAARYSQEGKERMANGIVVADFTPYDVRSGLEIAGQALGFPPQKVQIGWERELAKQDAVQFYKTWQMSIQRQLNIAYMQEDREAISDARDAYKQYNENVPMPEMRIKPKDAKDAIRDFIKSQYKAGAGFSAERKFQRLTKSVEEAFPDPFGDSVRKDLAGHP